MAKTKNTLYILKKWLPIFDSSELCVFTKQSKGKKTYYGFWDFSKNQRKIIDFFIPLLDIWQPISSYFENKGSIEAKPLVEDLVARYGGNWVVFASESDQYYSLWLSSDIENLNIAYRGVNWFIFRY